MMDLMLQFSKQQMALFRQSKTQRVSREIARDLVVYRADGVPQETFEKWVHRRVIAYANKADIVRKRHVLLLCFWEASLGIDRFAELREQGLEVALKAKAPEQARMDRAMAALRRFLGA